MPDDAKTLEDAALGARRIAAAGPALDSAAETELYRRLAPRVRLYGLRHLRDRHAAHDLMQQVLLMTLERLRAGKLREPERIASFVLGMCRMVVLEIRRGTWRRESLLETYGDTAEAAEHLAPVALDADKLAGCLQALVERERTVVVLTFFADRSSDEVTQELGLAAGIVRLIRHRALARSRGCAGAWTGGPHDGHPLRKAHRSRGAGGLLAGRAAAGTAPRRFSSSDSTSRRYGRRHSTSTSAPSSKRNRARLRSLTW